MDKYTLIELHKEWVEGRSKNDIERVEFNDPASHGKHITRLWREIGIETEAIHPLVAENARLRDLLERNGIDPE
jgi:hypothetical protein